MSISSGDLPTPHQLAMQTAAVVLAAGSERELQGHLDLRHGSAGCPSQEQLELALPGSAAGVRHPLQPGQRTAVFAPLGDVGFEELQLGGSPQVRLPECCPPRAPQDFKDPFWALTLSDC